MNKVNKGYRIERACQLILQKDGYITWKTMRVKFANIDLWGLFDVVGLASDGSHILFIQCKSNKTDNLTRERIKALKMPPDCYKEIWIWKDRKEWKKERIE